MTQLYSQTSQQGVWMALGPPQSAAFMLGQALTVTYGDGSQDSVSAHVPAVTSAGTTQVDRRGAVWLLYVVKGDPTLRIVREMDQAQVAGSYAPLARVLADRVVPYQPDNGQAQSSTSGQSFLPLTVTNNSSTQSIGGSTTVPVAPGSTDYVVQCVLGGATAASVWNALSDKTNFTDLQVLFAGSEIDADIDQATNGAWSSSTITCWFRLQRPIAASSSDSGYQLRMGGGLRSSPPRSWANIYPLADDFVGSSLDTARWSALNSPSLSFGGGTLTITSPGSDPSADRAIQSVGTWGVGYLVSMRGTLPATGAANLEYNLLWRSGINTQPGARIVSNNSQVPWLAQAYGPGGTPTGSATLAAADAGTHIFQIARDASGLEHAWSDGSSAVVAGVSVTAALAVQLGLYNVAAGPISMTADWVKVRPWISAEPTCSAGSLQSAGALRWEPITDTSGSVLVDSSGAPVMALVTIT